MYTKEQLVEFVNMNNKIRECLMYICRERYRYFSTKVKELNNSNVIGAKALGSYSSHDNFISPFEEEEVFMFTDGGYYDDGKYKLHPSGVEVFGRDYSNSWDRKWFIVPFEWIEAFDMNKPTGAFQDAYTLIHDSVDEYINKVLDEEQAKAKIAQEDKNIAKKQILKMMKEHGITKECL